ncbi:stalk domain-containing protein [Aedoeadaptatus coxii]|uniref:stalk domain-containing protein n=1 Tax=Aedoeadaptatus coxii TaxID=755172 RepID=UPI002AD328F3|nr:stalk domain-containing protein [Peptoniphilus coxii]
MEQRITRIVGFVFVLAMLIGLPLVNTQKAYATSEVPIDEANFPDVNFRNYVSKNFDKDNDGILNKNERNIVTKIDVSSTPKIKEQDKVKSLKGIEYFTVLTELDCSGNRLLNLDVTKNTALKRLNCDSNELRGLNISENTALDWLSCDLNQLTLLDISKNKALRHFGCQGNQLTSLDVSHNTGLIALACTSNKLKSLDISENADLEFLDCRFNQLKTVDVKDNTALTSLACGGNPLISLDVSENTALSFLDCSSSRLTNLDMSKNTALSFLDCRRSRLTSLDMSKNTALTDIYCDNNQLTTLDVSKNIALRSFGCDNNQLTTLDVSKNIALRSFRCQNNKLKSLDVSKNTALIDFYCGNNQLTTLDVSKNTELYAINISKNPLTSVKLVDKDYTRENLNPTYIVNVPKGTSEIKFPKGFKIENIVGTIPGIAINGDSLEWDGITKHTSFQYRLCENPEKIVNVSVDIRENGIPELEEAELLVEKAEEDKTQEAYLVAKAKVDVLRNGHEKYALEQRLSEVKKVIEEARAIDAAKAHQQHQVPSNSYSSGYITLVPVLEQSKAKGKNKVTMEARMTVGSKNLVRTVDGNVTNITMDVAAYIEKDRTYIPLRFVGEALGFDVTWDNASRTAILKNRDKVVKVAVDSNVFYVNGEKFESDVKPQIKNSRTMIPVGNFARAIGLKDGETIFWNDKTREVRIIQEIKL